MFWPDDLFDRIEDARVGGEVVGPAMKEMRIAGLRGIRAGAELLAKVFVAARKHAVSSFDKTGMGKRIPLAPIGGDFFFAQIICACGVSGEAAAGFFTVR